VVDVEGVVQVKARGIVAEDIGQIQKCVNCKCVICC
jgi:hypothetical protein